MKKQKEIEEQIEWLRGQRKKEKSIAGKEYLNATIKSLKWVIDDDEEYV